METLTEPQKRQGQRMRKLQNAFHVTVKYALRGVPAEEFEAFFPEKSLAPEVLEAVYDAYCQVLHQARIFIDREFDEICVEKNMADKLQSLEVMCAEQGFGDGAGSGQNGASGPTQIARRAALKAKREAAAHLAAIRDEVERRVAELELQLEDRRKVSGDLVSSAQPLQAQLADVQDLAKEWVHRGSAPAGDPTPHAAQTTPGPAPMAMA